MWKGVLRMRKGFVILICFLLVISLSTFLNLKAANADDWTSISGNVTYNGTPICAMVLANGQYGE